MKHRHKWVKWGETDIEYPEVHLTFHLCACGACKRVSVDEYTCDVDIREADGRRVLGPSRIHPRDF